MRAAVVGHVEWIEFIRVEEVPAPGEIVHASEAWAEAAGGGAVAAVQLANLGCETSFFTALGDDELGRRARDELEATGLAAPRRRGSREPQRRGVTYVDDAGERTITVIGEKHRPRGGDDTLPWEELQRSRLRLLHRRRRRGAVEGARTRASSSRRRASCRRSCARGVELDALVGSATDAGERYEPGDLDPPPRLVRRDVRAARRLGAAGRAVRRGRPAPGPIEDAYGAGDCFAAGLTFALGRGDEPRDALALRGATAARPS